jgi:transcription elongation factor Elf1
MTKHPNKLNKYQKYLAYRYGSWTCKLCGAVNVLIETEYKSGGSYGEIIEICNCCGQSNEEEMDEDI